MTTHQMLGLAQVIRFGRETLFIFLISTSLIHAQGKNSKELQVIGGAGVLLNHGNEYYNNDKELKIGYTFGTGILYHKSNFGINLRALWELKGFKSSEEYINAIDNTYGVAEIDRNINYITIQVLPSLNFGRNNKFSVAAGGYYSLLASVSTSLTHFDKDGNVIFHRNSKYIGNASSDFGVSFALGYSIPITTTNKIVVQIIDNYGLVDFTESFGYNIKSNSISLQLSYSFSR